MLQIRTILVPTDRSACAERAYAPAVELAARYGAKLRVVHVSEPGFNLVDIAPVTWDDIAQDLRLPNGHPPPSGPIHIEEIEASGLPAQTLLDYAREHDVDLVVMGTAGRRGFARLFLGSVAEELVRQADRPVLTVPCHDVPDGGPVVAPVDFSDGSREALRLAGALARERGAAVHALHVVEWPTELPPYLLGVGLPALPDVLDRAQVELAAFVAATVGPDVVTAVRVRLGGLAAYAVAEYAREVAAGLVVISTHGRTGLDRLLMGSVAERVVRMAPCPVLTVRPGTRGLLPAPSEAATAVGAPDETAAAEAAA